MFILELNDSEKIVLFEILNNLEDKDFKFDDAEKNLIYSLVANLEEQLVEPFSDKYLEILEKAKRNILSTT